MTVGGRYGAQPILAEVGMNFYVEKIADDADNRYYIHSWVNNPTTSQETGNADYLGVEPLMDTDQRIEFTDSKGATQKSIYLYVDRGINNTHDDGTNPAPDRIKWYIKPVDGYTNRYQIYSTWTDNLGGYKDEVKRNYYLSYYEGNPEEKPQKKFLVVTTDESLAETFYFIKIDNYLNVIKTRLQSISMYLVLCRMLVSNETTRVLMVICVAIIMMGQTMFGSSVTTETMIPIFPKIAE